MVHKTIDLKLVYYTTFAGRTPINEGKQIHLLEKLNLALSFQQENVRPYIYDQSERLIRN